MRIGVCTKPGDLPKKVDGLDYIETTVGHFLCPLEGEDVFDQRRREADSAPYRVVAANCLIPGNMKTTGEDVDTGKLDEYITTVMRRAQMAGTETLVFGSGGSRKVPDGFPAGEAMEQLTDHLRRWAPMAQDCDVTLVVEPLNTGECNIINSVRAGAELVRCVDHPHIRLLADTYHMALERETALNIREAGEFIVHAHCADSQGRVPLGIGKEDHGAYFKALKTVGYDGGVSIEAKWTNFARQLPKAVRCLREQIDSA
ncbi:MAG: sugar phosphate isomerase/epimerase family protein [Phycisphaerae bacterium]